MTSCRLPSIFSNTREKTQMSVRHLSCGQHCPISCLLPCTRTGVCDYPASAFSIFARAKKEPTRAFLRYLNMTCNMGAEGERRRFGSCNTRFFFLYGPVGWTAGEASRANRVYRGSGPPAASMASTSRHSGTCRQKVVADTAE
jgi:hypothetical protein